MTVVSRCLLCGCAVDINKSYCNSCTKKRNAVRNVKPSIENSVEYWVNKAYRVSEAKNPTWVGFHIAISTAKEKYDTLNTLDVSFLCACDECQQERQQESPEYEASLKAAEEGWSDLTLVP